MTLKEYTAGAQAFAQDSQEWGSNDEYKHYITTGSNWIESIDNGEGGLDVSWAFHKDDEYISQNAPQHFINQLLDQVDQARDEGWDDQQWAAMLSTFR